MSNFNAEYSIPDTAPSLERGPDWLVRRRHSSQEAFNETPVPRRGLHLWRYTDPTRFMFEQSADAAEVSDDQRQVVKTANQHLADGHLAGLAADYAGRGIDIYGAEKLSARGILLMPLSAAVEEKHELVAPHLYELVGNETGKFEAMNGALWNDGLFLYVPDGIAVERPIHLVRQAAGSGTAQFPRLLVVVGRNSEVTLIDEYGGGPLDNADGQAYSNGAVEIFAHDDSRTRYVMLQRQSSATYSYLTHRARIGAGAHMLTVPLAFGASLSKQNFGVILNGKGAESRMSGLLFGSTHQHFDNHTLHHHTVSQTHSTIDFKVVLRDKAISAYTGLIRIEKQAMTCEAYQENRNLLLNQGTRAETIPELEILNEDVSCSHGATVGPIDPLMIFYLNSRGIPANEATRMVVSGFVAATLQQVPEDLRQQVTDFVARRLEDL